MTKNKEKFLLIAGAKASGKSLIRGILDGHPDLFVSPFHELVLQSLYVDSSQNFKTKDIEQIRAALASKGNYFQLERLSRQDYYINISGKDFRHININFDFYSFDRSWVENLYKSGTEWNSYDVCMSIYMSFSKHLSSSFIKSSDKKKYYCALSNGYSNAIAGFVKTFPNSKIIYIKRDPIEIVNALIARTKAPNDSRSNWFSRKLLLKKWGTYSFIRSIVDLDNEAKKVLKKFPNQILILDFNKFFDNLKNEILKIRKFLNISDNYALKYYSVAGYKMLNSDGSSLLSAPVDKGYANLSKLEINKLKKYLR